MGAMNANELPRKMGITLSDEMKDECAQTYDEQGSGRVNTDEQRHQHRGTEGHEKELNAHNGFPARRKIFCIRIILRSFFRSKRRFQLGMKGVKDAQTLTARIYNPRSVGTCSYGS